MKTGTVGLLFSSLVALATLFVGRLTLSAPGDLYVSDVAGKQILKFAPDGTKSVFASGVDAFQSGSASPTYTGHNISVAI